MAELQIIPARHGVATFVPAGQTIKVINTSGTQVIDTWAFALPEPEAKKSVESEEKESEKKEEQPKQQQQEEKKETPKPTPKKNSKKDKNDLPSQEDAEKATQDMLKQDGEQGKDAQNQATPQKSTWSSYVPSLGLKSSGKKATDAPPKKEETEVQKNSRTWSSYFPSGKGFSSCIPKSASNTVSAFAQDVSEPTHHSTGRS